MNQNLYYSKRKYAKLMDVISEVGGLIPFFIPILMFLFANFNTYKYELRLAEKSFTLRKQGKRLRNHEFTFFIYLRYRIYLLFGYYGSPENLKKFQQIEETLGQASYLIELERIINKLKKLESAQDYLLTEGEKICLGLEADPLIGDIRMEQKLYLYHQMVAGDYQITFKSLRECSTGDIIKQIGISELSKSSNILDVQGSSVEMQQKGDSSDTGVKSLKKFVEIERLLEKLKGQDIFTQVNAVIQNDPDLKQQAETFELPEGFEEVEDHITEAFLSLGKASLQQLRDRIPILILYRIGKVVSKRQASAI